MNQPPESRNRFWRFASAGIFFEGGVAAVEPATILAGLVHGLTGSTMAVGAAAAIVRYGWLFPQIFVAFIAQSHARRMKFYAIGGFGRAGCLAAIAGLIYAGAWLDPVVVVVGFFAAWTLYSFVSGIVAVPYNDIVARSIPSSRRSRLFAVRFFGGGLLALAVAAVVHEILARSAFHAGYAAVLAVAALTMCVSALCFVSAGEPAAPPPPRERPGFGAFLRDGLTVLREDTRFRLFLYVQLLAGGVSMSLPFYILQVAPGEPVILYAGVMLAARTTGAMLSNPLWGLWGDGRGKLDLLRLVCRMNAIAPAAVLVWFAAGEVTGIGAVPWFAAVFFVIGAVDNGRTIAYLGYLMEISPDDRRPAYSGYFNALAAPAALLPLLGAAIAEIVSFPAVFAVSLAAAGGQVLLLRRLSAAGGTGGG